jgi:two-component system cell cycle sensor histidine kinase/response regulator CckA
VNGDYSTGSAILCLPRRSPAASITQATVVNTPGPYVAVSYVLAGFAVFAGLHHLHLWLSRRERQSLYFALYCLPVAGLCAAHAASASATTLAGGQLALDMRTTIGLLAFVALLPLIALLSGVDAPRYRAAITALLLAGVVVNTFGAPLIGTVSGISTMTLPWGEQVSAFARTPADSSLSRWLPRVIYVGLATVQIYALIAARALVGRDRAAAWLVGLAGVTGLVGSIVGLLIDTQVIQLPYLGQVSAAAWVILVALLLSRDHVRRGDLLQSSERRFRAIFDQTFQFIGLLHTDGRVLEANRTALEFAGVRESDVVGKPFWETAWWTHSPALQAELRAAVGRAAAGETVRFEATHPRTDGQLAYVDFSLKPVRDQRGVVTLLIPEGREVTERRLAEKSLRASEASLAAVIANSPDVAIQWFDADGRVILWNRASEVMFGIRSEEAVGKTLDVLLHTPEEFARFRDALATIAREGQPIGPTEFVFHRGGESRTCFSTIFAIPADADGRPRFVCMDVDITERKQAEVALAVSEARYRTLIESAPEAIVVFDVDRFVFADVNDRACMLFGVPAETLKTLNPLDLSPQVQPDGRESAAAAKIYLERTIAGEAQRFEWVHRTLAGRDIPCEIRLVTLPDPVRTLIRGSITDISERLALEQQLRQAQKVQAIGQLAGGVAHDFNNLLTVIGGYAEVLCQQVPPGDPRLETIGAIQDAARRAAWLTDRLLAFSRRAVLMPQVVELNVVVRDAESMLRRLIGEDIRLDVELHSGPTRVTIDPGQWSQVIMNLAINARDAMPDGGTLRIATSTLDVTPAVAEGHPGTAAGRYVKLTVADTGTGMSREVLARLFEPFFTTKAVGHGTGLGLAVVHGIVSQAGGFITVDSAPGSGTAMAVHVPLVEVEQGLAPAQHSPPRPASAAADLAGRNIMVVEDEESVRRLVELSLQRQGARVLSAADGHEALRLLDSHHDGLDLLVTDVVMPGGIYGPQLAESARLRYPTLKTLFISGYIDDAKLSMDALDASQAFLQKPFTLATLVGTVREMIGRP